jgi:hypothetical protein
MVATQFCVLWGHIVLLVMRRQRQSVNLAHRDSLRCIWAFVAAVLFVFFFDVLAWGDVVSRSVMRVLIEIVEECAVIRWLCEVRVNLTLKTKKKSNNRHTI